MGNPTNYMGATMSWYARQMQSYSKNGTEITYKYDTNGLRTEKTVNGIKHEYYYVDGQLRFERNGDSYEIYYNYDADGRPVRAYKKDLVTGTNYSYYLITNTRGDVIETRNGSGEVNAKFTYDAWGKIISVTDGSGNELSSDSFAYQISLKYRGYVYDSETGLYYLQSRYYDPETGRFLNTDSVDYIGYSGEQLSYNAFAYGLNAVKSTSRSDSAGSFIVSSINGFVQNIINIIFDAFTIKYDVPLYYQGKTNLCWAYCQVMIEDYKSGTTKTQEQADKRAKEIAIEVNGADDWNNGGWPTNCSFYNLKGDPIPEFIDIYSIMELYQLLRYNGPVYALYSESKTVSHMVVVTGINLFKKLVYTNNPWGISEEQSFQDFLLGFSGGKKDGTYSLKTYYTVR